MSNRTSAVQRLLTEIHAPWNLEIDREFHNHQLRDAAGLSLAAFDEGEDGKTARLIGIVCAAAPDMLEALLGLANTVENDCDVAPCIGSMAPAEHFLGLARAAIAKATGERP